MNSNRKKHTNVSINADKREEQERDKKRDSELLNLKEEELETKSQPLSKEEKKTLVAYLRDKLKIPAKEAVKMVTAISATVNSNALAFNILTIARGWPEEQPKLILPVLTANYPFVLLGLSCALADMAESKRFEKGRKNYKTFVEGANSFTFLLRAIIAGYIFVVTDFGQDNKQVNSSDQTFFILVGASALPALISMGYNLWNNHSPFQSKLGRGVGVAVNTPGSSATVHDVFENIYPDNNNDYVLRLIFYAVSLAVGAGLTIGSNYSEEIATTILEIISAINNSYIHNEIYEDLTYNENEIENEIWTNVLFSVYLATFIALPILFRAGLAFCQRNSNDPEKEPLLNTKDKEENKIENKDEDKPENMREEKKEDINESKKEDNINEKNNNTVAEEKKKSNKKRKKINKEKEKEEIKTENEKIKSEEKENNKEPIQPQDQKNEQPAVNTSKQDEKVVEKVEEKQKVMAKYGLFIANVKPGDFKKKYPGDLHTHDKKASDNPKTFDKKNNPFKK